MDQLDRMYRTLVQTIRTNHPQYLTQPFEVAELYQTILPYRHDRRSLGFETNQDYEVTLLELLSGERGYLLVDERMRDALRRELASPNPDPAAFRLFGSSQVSLAHEPLRQLEGAIGTTAETAAVRASGAAPVAAEPRSGGQLAAPRSEPAPSVAAPTPALPTASMEATRPAQSPRASAGTVVPRGTPAAGASAEGMIPMERGVIPAAGEECRFCSGVLPPGRRIVFCPHCGQDLTVQHCLACGTELELGWRFCISCGRAATSG
jgi:hypothetical protein